MAAFVVHLLLTMYESQLDTSSADFLQNTRYMQQLVQELKERLKQSRKERSPRAIQKHRDRNKMFVYERVEALKDPGTEFMEFSPLCAQGVYDFPAPGAGVVTGILQIEGRECVLVANDATVKGGTYLPLSVKKHLRAQEVAMENHLPCVYLVDSGGAFLPMQSEVFPDREHFGRIFYNQARMSAMGLEQLSAVMGSCTAGGAYVPAMSCENIIVQNQGHVFLGGPPLVKAATGEDISAEALGGAQVHCHSSGVTDHMAQDDAHALALIREILSRKAGVKKWGDEKHPVRAPAFDPKELYGIVPQNPARSYDVREIILRLVDEGSFFEFKAAYGSSLVTAFARIWGQSVGVLANQGVLFSDSALKAAHFIEYCDAHCMPLVFLHNITGFMVGKDAEKGGIAKDGAKMVTAVACARVPKFSVVIGGSYGAGNYGMCGRAYSPRQLWMWPNARIAVMGGEAAEKVLSRVGAGTSADVLKNYQKQSCAYFSTAHLWDDGVIDPLDTRKFLALGLEASRNAPMPERMAKVFRM